MTLQQACSTVLASYSTPVDSCPVLQWAQHIVDSTIGAVYLPHTLTTPKAALAALRRNTPIFFSTVYSIYGNCQVAAWQTKFSILVYPILPFDLIPDSQLHYYTILSSIPGFEYNNP
jgi:hypothetical protein